MCDGGSMGILKQTKRGNVNRQKGKKGRHDVNKTEGAYEME